MAAKKVTDNEKYHVVVAGGYNDVEHWTYNNVEDVKDYIKEYIDEYHLGEDDDPEERIVVIHQGRRLRVYVEETRELKVTVED